MSWDEKDWSNTYITGKPERFGKSEIKDRGYDNEICHHIKLYGFDVPCLSYPVELDRIAKSFGVMIEYRYLGGEYHCYDYRDFEPILSKKEIELRDLVQETYNIVSKY